MVLKRIFSFLLFFLLLNIRLICNANERLIVLKCEYKENLRSVESDEFIGDNQNTEYFYIDYTNNLVYNRIMETLNVTKFNDKEIKIIWYPSHKTFDIEKEYTIDRILNKIYVITKMKYKKVDKLRPFNNAIGSGSGSCQVITDTPRF